MATTKLIALEWDAREARIAVGSSRGSDVVVEAAFAFDLATGASDEVASFGEVGTQLAAVLAQHGLTGSDAVLAVPRSSIELRTLSLPQAPPEEVPDIVRFQAMQAFTSIGEDWPVDYVELESHGESIKVLAAVVAPQLLEQTKEACKASDLKLRALVLRPFAAVSLLHRFEAIDVFRNSLVVDLLPDATDLTAVSNGHVVFMRSVRLPSLSDATAQAAALVSELRRTIGAAQNQMGGSRIEQVIICGGESQHAVLRKSVADALGLDVTAFDPFEAVRLSRQLKDELPANSGRFAPLLGMLACQVTGAGHTIDFLNPRKRPRPPSQRRRNLIMAAGVAAVATLGSFLFLHQKQKLDNQITELTAESLALDKDVEEARRLVGKSDRVQVFTDGDITWLDELREVARRLPNADHVILREVTIMPDQDRGGRMILKGNVVSSDVIAQLEQSLRYGKNVVDGRIGLIDRSNREYPYQLDTTIAVPPDVQKDGHSQGRPKFTESPAGDDAAQEDMPAESPAADPNVAVQPSDENPIAEEESPTSDEDADSTPEESDPGAAVTETGDDAASPTTPDAPEPLDAAGQAEAAETNETPQGLEPEEARSPLP